MTCRPVRSSQAGTTLIELLVTIAIMGISFVGVVGGIGSAIIGADFQKRGATSGIVLTSAAEEIVADTTAYSSCGEPAYPDPPAQSGYDVAIDAVLFWDPQSSEFATGCPTTGDAGIQFIRLKLTPPAGPRASDVEFLEVVKRQPQVNS